MASLLSALGLDTLSTERRWQLLQELSDSLEAEAKRPPLPEARMRKRDRRGAALGANPDAVVPRDEVEKRRVEALLIEGLDSGPSTPMTPQDWDEVEREGRRLIAEREGLRVR